MDDAGTGGYRESAVVSPHIITLAAPFAAIYFEPWAMLEGALFTILVLAAFLVGRGLFGTVPKRREY